MYHSTSGYCRPASYYENRFANLSFWHYLAANCYHNRAVIWYSAIHPNQHLWYCWGSADRCPHWPFDRHLLAKAAPPKFAKVIHTAVELLAGIPSVVYGLVGMIILVPGIQRAFDLPSGATLLAAIIVLTIMILPSIINVSETALRAVPREYEEASMALGATEMETFFRVSVPAAKSGIAAAVVLGVGRAIGEAMAIIMVSGNVANLPGLLTSVRFMTTAIASEMAYAAAGSLQQQALFSIGLVLFLFIMMINVFLNVFVKGRRTA